MTYKITIHTKNGDISRVLHANTEEEAKARVDDAISHGRRATYCLLKPYNHWEYILKTYGIEIKTVEGMDKAFKADMRDGYSVDGDYNQYKHPDYITFDELTKKQKEIFMELGFDWDRAGRIGRYNQSLFRDEVLSILNKELRQRSL